MLRSISVALSIAQATSKKYTSDQKKGSVGVLEKMHILGGESLCQYFFDHSETPAGPQCKDRK